MTPSPQHSSSPITEPASASATALGSWPGTDPVEAAKVSVGIFPGPNLPFLPQLPARGVGSDHIGRTAALLTELPVDVQPYGWRFVDRPGLDFRRAESALSTDINVLADVVGAGELSPAAFKVQVTGPFSMAASIHLHYGERAVRDYGARRDIAQSLAAGLHIHALKIQSALPGAALTLQIDEPHIAAVLAGSIPTASGYRTLRAIPRSELRQTWSDLVAAARLAGFSQVAINVAPAQQALTETAAAAKLAGTPAQSTTSDGTPTAEATAWRQALEIALECGVDAVAVPLNLLDGGHWEMLAGALESGVGVWAGTVPASAGQVPPSYAALVERIMRPWRKLGLAESGLNQLRITEESSLAALTPQEARAVLGRSLDVAQALGDIRNA
ncbi:uroporphyrinogen decarboxylase/cobalamine-independent methonine synthase family protein [Arthrobacter sp. Sr24]